jgi:hypothetical protein
MRGALDREIGVKDLKNRETEATETGDRETDETVHMVPALLAKMSQRAKLGGRE